MTNYNSLLTRAIEDYDDKTILRRLRNEFSTHFQSFFLENGFSQAPAGKLVPKDDASVLFTGSTISTLKPVLLSGSIPPNGLFMVQDCLRTQNSRRIQDNNYVPNWSSMFLSTGTLSQYDDVEKVSKLFWQFLTERLCLNPNTIKIHIASSDVDLVDFWKNLGLDQYLVFDTKEPVYYTHKFGIDGITGRNCNIAIKGPYSEEYGDIGNIIIIEAGERKLGVEMAFGVETAISRMTGLPTPIHAAPIAEFLPTETNDELKIADAVAASTFIMRSGIKPVADGRGRVLRSYLQGIAELLPRTMSTPADLERASKQMEKVCFGTASKSAGGLIAAYVSSYQDLKEKMGPDRAILNKRLTKLAVDFA
ncbi:MAG: alanine--tRNA ligase-related protein [Bdellovibrionales bacterium]